jgi:hypothetical protein
LQDRRDARVIEGFVPGDLSAPMPAHHWRWYDVAANKLLRMGAVPAPADVAGELRGQLPLTHRPFAWNTAAPGRPGAGRVRFA